MRIKLSVCLVILLFIGANILAQSVSVQWMENSDGTRWDILSDIVMDKHSNTYVACNYTALSKRNVVTSTGAKDVFIAKYNSDGKQIWYKQINNEDYCHIASLKLDSLGQLLISGFFSKEIRLGTEVLTVKHGNCAFFAMMDSVGQFIFAKKINGNFRGFISFSSNSLSEPDYYFAGSYSGDIIIDDITIKGNNKSNIFIGKFNDKGNLIKYSILDGSGDDLLEDLLIAKTGNIYLTGSFENDLRIEYDILLSNGLSDAFIVQLDKELHLVDSKQIGGHYQDYGKNIKLDSRQNLVWTGCFSGDIQIANRQKLSSNGNLDVFICKYDIDGKLIWGDQFGGQGNDYLSSTEINEFNSIYFCGNFKSSIDKENETLRSIGSLNDVFFVKYDSFGKFQYMESFGSHNSDFARKLVIDTANYMYLTGNFNSSFIAINDSTKNGNDLDFFITKLYDCSFGTAIDLPADTALCGSSYVIFADTNFIDYTWNNISGGAEYEVDTTNLYELTVLDNKHCSSSDTIMVVLYTEPTVDLGSDQFVFKGEIIQLFAEQGMDSYLWNDNSYESYLDINTIGLQEGTYTFSVIVTDTNFCNARDEINIAIIDLLNEGSSDDELSASIFPNPAKNHFTLKLDNLDISSLLNVDFYSVNGVKLLNFAPKINSSNLEIVIDIQSFNAGSYLILIKNGTTLIKRNVVIVK